MRKIIYSWLKKTRYLDAGGGFFILTFSNEVINTKKQDEIDPQPVQKMPVNGKQAQFQPFFRIGEVDKDCDGVHHAFFGGLVKQHQKRQTGDNVGEVNERNDIEVSGSRRTVQRDVIVKQPPPGDRLHSHEQP